MLNLAALVLLYMSTPTPAAVQDNVDPQIARMAAGLQEMIGRRTPGDMVVTGAHGEGRTLIMDVELPADVPALIGPREAAMLTAASMCGRGRGATFFSGGRALRLNAVRAGRALGSATVDRCPGPVGGGPAGTFAARMQAFVGVETDGVRLVSARAEGNSVIVTVDVVSGATSGAEAAAQFAMGVCLRPDMQTAFFGQGLTLRVDATVRGRDPVTGTPITSCPAAQGGVDPLVAEMARALSTPSETGDVRRIAVRGEGRTLVWEGEIAPDLAGSIRPADFAAVLANGICTGAGGAAFFTEGRKLRVEIRPAGGSSASATVDHCSVPAGVGLTAASLASMMQPLVGRDMDGVRVTSIRAEGETVIFVFDGAIGWRRGITAGMLEGAFLGNFCGQAAANSPFFNGTRSIRIDTLEGGREPIQGRPVSACPAR